MDNWLETPDELGNHGFKEFYSVKDLRAPLQRSPAPRKSGIYLVIRKQKGRPNFLVKGTANKIIRTQNGKKICKDPNVDIECLKKKWVKGARILYVGRSGNLRARIGQLIRFGNNKLENNKTKNHGGGRYLWQIENPENLEICWKLVPKNKKEPERKQILEKFKKKYQGQLPFANINN